MPPVRPNIFVKLGYFKPIFTSTLECTDPQSALTCIDATVSFSSQFLPYPSLYKNTKMSFLCANASIIYASDLHQRIVRMVFLLRILFIFSVKKRIYINFPTKGVFDTPYSFSFFINKLIGCLESKTVASPKNYGSEHELL